MNATTKPGFPQQKPIGWLAPELPNHWCCKPCLLSVLRFDSTRKPYYEEASGAVEAVFIAKSTFTWQAVGRHSKAVQWGSYVLPTKEPTGVPKVSMDWVCQHQNVWAPKQSEEPLQATGSWTSRHPGIVVSTLWKSTLCVLFLIFNLKLKSGVSIQTSKATSPRKLFSIWRVWHSSKSWSWGEGVSLACHLDCSSISNPVAEPAMLWTAVRL